MNSKRADYLIPVTITILFFLAKKQIIPSFIYLIIVIPAGFYYLPFKLILFFKDAGESTLTEKLKVLTTNLIFYMILFLSILRLFLDVDKKLNVLIDIIGIFTVISFYYYSIADKKSNISLVYLLFLILISSVAYT